MKRLFRRTSMLVLTVLAFIFVSITGCIKALNGQQQYIDSGASIASVTNLIQNAVNKTPLEGAAMLAVKNGQVIYKKAFGDYTPNTVVPIASASKWISASVIMTLVDDGLIALGDRVSKYLPSFRGDKSTITIRQLLSHTSGLPSNHPCLNNSSISLTRCVYQISQVRLEAVPGTEFRYGGVSFQVAGRVAEAASGKSWNTLFEEKIKDPLSMVNTSYGNTSNPRIAGGAASTLQDYANLLQMHLNGGVFNGKRVLSSASVMEMQRDQTNGVRIAFTPQRDSRSYGLGEWRDIVDANGKAIQLSSQGAFGFSPWIDLKQNLLGVFLVKDRLNKVYRLVEQVQSIFRR